MKKKNMLHTIAKIFCIFSAGLVIGYLLCRIGKTNDPIGNDTEAVEVSTVSTEVVADRGDMNSNVVGEDTIEKSEEIEIRLFNGVLQIKEGGLWTDVESLEELMQSDPVYQTQLAKVALEQELLAELQQTEETDKKTRVVSDTFMTGQIQREEVWNPNTNSTTQPSTTVSPEQPSTPPTVLETPVEETPADGEDMEWTDDYL